MRYFSLFTGIGGFELGILKADMKKQGIRAYMHGVAQKPECVGYSEIDKYAIQIYQKHFPNHKNYGDITKIDESTLPDFDFLCGGFPCQSFSIAGKRKGFEDTRGTLFFDIARILKAKQPRLLLLENVKGLLSHDNGDTFKTIIATLDELGYDLQWQVLNSKNFGVPQNRERVLIVGHFRGTPRPEVFPLHGSDEKDIESRTDESQGSKALCIKTRHLGQNGGLVSPIVQTLQVAEIPHIVQLNKPKHSNDRVYGAEGIAPTLNTMQGGNRQPFISKTIRSGGRSSPHGSKQNWDSYEFEGMIRRLTPTECERLQGFPDGWTEGVSDTQRYKCLGNAVTTNVIQAVMEKIL